jgi:hypothetical protein
VAEPSRADELLTQTLKQALALVEIKTLDHFIVAGSHTVSFAERGCRARVALGAISRYHPRLSSIQRVGASHGSSLSGNG